MKLKKRATLSIKDSLKFLPDTLYVKLYYFAKLGYLPDMKNPRTYNEKLQLYKLHYRDSRLHSLVDKYEVRSYVAKTIGEEYLVPLIGVYTSVEELMKSKLPTQFVVKCTHDSQSTHVCTDISTFDFDRVAKDLRIAMRRDWYWQGREWAYKGITPRIIVESYLNDSGHVTPNDYKFYCFDGNVHLVQCDENRFENSHKQQYFSPKWDSYGDWHISKVAPEEILPVPDSYDLMLNLSEKLSEGFPHVRVDWYCIDGHPYFGELTFYTGGGFDPFYDREDTRNQMIDIMLGEVFNLPDTK